MWWKLQINKTDRPEATDIETLEEILESLRITKEYILNRNSITELALENILTMLILAVYNKNIQAVILKSIVLDPG